MSLHEQIQEVIQRAGVIRSATDIADEVLAVVHSYVRNRNAAALVDAADLIHGLGRGWMWSTNLPDEVAANVTADLHGLSAILRDRARTLSGAEVEPPPSVSASSPTPPPPGQIRIQEFRLNPCTSCGGSGVGGYSDPDPDPKHVENCRCAELGAGQREHIDGVCIPRYIVGS